MHTLAVDSGIAARVQTGDAQFKTAVMRGVGGELNRPTSLTPGASRPRKSAFRCFHPIKYSISILPLPRYIYHYTILHDMPIPATQTGDLGRYES